jgi:hypothetical protein
MKYMKNMKCFLALMTAAALLAALPGLLVSCDSFVGSSEQPNGTVTIQLGTTDNGARAALSDAVIDTLSYTVEFRGPKDQVINREVENGAGKLRLSLALGKWAISALAYTPEGVEIGSGGVTVTITPGEGAITIPMTAYSPIGIAIPADITINGVPANGSISLSRSNGDTLSITLTDTYTSIAWYLDDVLQPENGGTFSRSAGDLQIRRHTLMVMVEKEDRPYSTTISFSVVP